MSFSCAWVETAPEVCSFAASDGVVLTYNTPSLFLTKHIIMLAGFVVEITGLYLQLSWPVNNDMLRSWCQCGMYTLCLYHSIDDIVSPDWTSDCSCMNGMLDGMLAFFYRKQGTHLGSGHLHVRMPLMMVSIYHQSPELLGTFIYLIIV